jgi:hypothetical protein
MIPTMGSTARWRLHSSPRAACRPRRPDRSLFPRGGGVHSRDQRPRLRIASKAAARRVDRHLVLASSSSANSISILLMVEPTKSQA